MSEDLNLADIISRYTQTDIRPDREDPLLGLPIRARILGLPGAAADAGGREIPFTPPGQRPVTYQTAQNLDLIATDTATPIMPSLFPADGIILSVPTGGQPVRFGYGSGLTVGSGVELVPAQPVLIGCDNTRELWELQRLLEAMFAVQNGFPLPPFRAPRVAMDLSRWFLIAAAGVTQPVGGMVINIPEMQ